MSGADVHFHSLGDIAEKIGKKTPIISEHPSAGSTGVSHDGATGGPITGGGSNLSRPGYLYIIQQGNTGYYKYGITGDPKARIRNLQTGNPQKLSMVCRPVNNMLEAGKELSGKIKPVEGGGKEWTYVAPGEEEKLHKDFLKVARKYS